MSAQKTCQHCALKVSPSTVGVQAPIATGWSVDGGRAAGSMERDQVRFDCGPKGAALIRSYHPNGWIAQAAARVAARAAAGSGGPGRLGLKRLGRLAGRRSGGDGSG